MERLRVPLEQNDWLVPAALAAVATAEILAVADVPRGVALGTVLAACALLAGRRRLPLVFGPAAALALFSQTWLGMEDSGRLSSPLLVLFLACYSIGRYVPSRWGLAAVAGIDLVLHWSSGITVPALDDVLWAGVLTAGPWVFGRLVLARARDAELLAGQARQLVEEQQHVAERAVAEERRRIARELHDVVAHSLSVMVVQAAAASDLLASDRAGAARSLAEIQRAGREALGETGRLLGLLRADEVDTGAPQPRARDLPRLVDAFRTSGMDIELVMDGPTEALPAGVDLSVYRIVEEGLTNALKHAPGGTTRVEYRRGPDRIGLRLLSSSADAARSLTSNGYGLIGMRERVAVFGGSFEAAPASEGGFAVSAQLPLRGTA